MLKEPKYFCNISFFSQRRKNKCTSNNSIGGKEKIFTKVACTLKIGKYDEHFASIFYIFNN